MLKQEKGRDHKAKWHSRCLPAPLQCASAQGWGAQRGVMGRPGPVLPQEKESELRAGL